MKKYFVILFIGFIGSTLHGQEIDGEECRKIVITGSDTAVYTYVLISNPKKIKIDLEKNYHWYYSNNIYANKGGFSGKLLHGPYEVQNIDGQLEKAGKLSLGLQVGEWKYWNNKGDLIRYEKWDKGKLTVAKVYNSRGKLVKENVYETEQTKEAAKAKRKEERDKKKKENEIKKQERKAEKKQKKITRIQEKEKNTDSDKTKKEGKRKDKKKTSEEEKEKKPVFSWFGKTYNNIKAKLKRDKAKE